MRHKKKNCVWLRKREKEIRCRRCIHAKTWICMVGHVLQLSNCPFECAYLQIQTILNGLRQQTNATAATTSNRRKNRENLSHAEIFHDAVNSQLIPCCNLLTAIGSNYTSILNVENCVKMMRQLYFILDQMWNCISDKFKVINVNEVRTKLSYLMF